MLTLPIDTWGHVRRELRVRRRVFWHFLVSRHRLRHLTPRDLWRYLASPTDQMIAKKHIRQVVRDGAHFVVHLHGFERPLFWPAHLHPNELLMGIAEILSRRHWHFYEVPEVAVRPGDVVVDCGAAEGLFGLTVLDRAAAIFMIEPLPVFQASLTKTFAGRPDCKILDCAVGDSPSRGRLVIEATASRVGERGELEISIDTIDRLFFREGIHIDFLKADIEGFEFNMLRGAVETIRTMKPRIAITSYHRSQDADEMMRFVLSLVPDYRYRFTGVGQWGTPVLMHFWRE